MRECGVRKRASAQNIFSKECLWLFAISCIFNCLLATILDESWHSPKGSAINYWWCYESYRRWYCCWYPWPIVCTSWKDIDNLVVGFSTCFWLVWFTTFPLPSTIIAGTAWSAKTGPVALIALLQRNPDHDGWLCCVVPRICPGVTFLQRPAWGSCSLSLAVSRNLLAMRWTRIGVFVLSLGAM